MNISSLKQFFVEQSVLADVLTFAGILVLSWVLLIIVRKILLRIVEKVVRKSKMKFDDHLFESKAPHRIAYLVPLLIIHGSMKVVTFPDQAENIITQTVEILFILIILLSITSFFKGLNAYYETLLISRERPIKGYLQVTNIVMYLIGLIFVVGLITEKSPWAILTGIGAMTAILLLIFRDTILSFVSGIQITGYDLIHKGDWIEVPAFGADGDVIDIALHTVSVQNWDKTITVIPTHKLTEGGFKNWRGMTQTGGRRIKRSVYIDLGSIRFCDEEMIQRFKKIQMITDYVEKKVDELKQYNRAHHFDDNQPVNGRRMTNIGTFRIYVEQYLKNHPRIRKDLTCMVRQLAPESEGLPIEIYAFADDTAWVRYEQIQADIFDHILAVVPHFDLRIFQNPAGGDLRELGGSLLAQRNGYHR